MLVGIMLDRVRAVLDIGNAIYNLVETCRSVRFLATRLVVHDHPDA